MNQKLVFEILSAVSDWRMNPPDPSFDFPILYPDSLGFIPSLKTEEDGRAKENFRQFECYLQLMTQKGLITVTTTNVDTGYVTITQEGVDWIESYHNNVWWKKALRMLWGSAGKAMTSIVLPIIVAVLTVLVLKYFGLLKTTSVAP